MSQKIFCPGIYKGIYQNLILQFKCTFLNLGIKFFALVQGRSNDFKGTRKRSEDNKQIKTQLLIHFLKLM